jgi:DNA-binding NtrC family response regulator
MNGPKPLLVIVDDEQGILDLIQRFAERTGYDVITYSNGREAIAQMQTVKADLVMVDLRMPEVGGLDVLRAIRDSDPRCQAVLMTGYASVETAVEAIKLGASDYLSKPLDFARLEQLLTGVRDELERRRSLLAIETDVARRLEFCGMIGRGPAMQELFGMIRRLAPHVRTALVTGETGTGKELVARALHRMGPRRDRRFVTVNCSAVVETLFESELFGHTRGAFTGATENKPGLFELADNGTLFLDEIGELPTTVQAKLLRVLELGEVHRVGSLEPRRVNAHVIAATNRDLRAEVAAGRFRSDLYYRLNIVEVKLPPLRERREDIPYLTAAFVRETAERLQKTLLGLTPGAERLLGAAAWDGNVRELKNVMERTAVLCQGGAIGQALIRSLLPEEAEAAPPEYNLDRAVAEVERRLILRALAATDDNKAAASALLGIGERTLWTKLKRHGL